MTSQILTQNVAADDFDDLDKLVQDVKSLDFYSYIIPEEADDKQKEKFQNGEIEKPGLKYSGPDEKEQRDIERLWNRIGRAEVPETGDVKQEVYERTLAECAEMLSIMENIDERVERPELDGTLTGRSSYIFGELSDEAVETAEEWLENGYENAVETSEEVMAPIEVKETFKKRLENDGVAEDWDVELYEEHGMRVNPANQKIYVPKDRPRPEKRVENLLEHEYEGHAKRGINGEDQPWGILSSGTGGFEPMSEGLAVYLEDISGTLTNERAEELAARTKAVKMDIYKEKDDEMNPGKEDGERKSWRETYDTLTEEYGVDEDTAYTAVKRAKMAGSIHQGQLYLSGYKRFKEIVDEYDEEDIYVGKISFEDLEGGIHKHEEIQEARDVTKI